MNDQLSSMLPDFFEVAEQSSDLPDAAISAGYVFNIQRFTIHDGPGIRTEIFLKGCTLHCQWCSNPEGIRLQTEIGVYASRCIGADKCGYCLAACPRTGRNIFLRDENRITGIDRSLCDGCAKCAQACPANALVIWGRKTSTAEVMKAALADIEFYEKSGGGITVSGGDALVQWQFTLSLLNECRRQHIHTCIETALNVHPAILDAVYPAVDMVIADIKHMDSALHKKYTGAGNELILSNLVKTAALSVPLILRIPVVPEYNNDEKNIRETAKFIVHKLNNKVLQVQLLPYRQLGLEKYKSLGLPYPLEANTQPERSVWEGNIRHLASVMKGYGVPAVAGSTVKT